MARNFDRSSSEYIDIGKTTYTVGLDGAAVASISCIMKYDVVDINKNIFSIATSTGSGAFVLGMDSNSYGKLGGRSVTGDSYQSALTDDVLTENVEYALGSYIDIANDKIRLYVDGSPQTEASKTFDNAVWNTGTPSINNAIGVNSVGNSDFWGGMIAELAIWNVKLSADEFAMLADRCVPFSVRSQNLIGYWSLVRDVNDRILGIVGSPSGTTVIPHPRIIEEGSTRGVWAISAGITHVLSGSFAGVGVINGVFIRKLPIAGVTAGVSILSSGITIKQIVAGVMSAVSSLVGVFVSKKNLRGDI